MGLGTQTRLIASQPQFIEGSATANWQSGVATSGLAGGDLLLIGTPTTIYYPMGIFSPMVVIWIGDLTPGADITYRVYSQVFGSLQFNYDDDYIVGVDPNVMPVLVWAMRGQTRIEIHSDNALDNGATIPYEYMLKTY